jgi:hypothetical protein
MDESCTGDWKLEISKWTNRIVHSEFSNFESPVQDSSILDFLSVPHLP